MLRSARDQLEVGVAYQPAEVGPYLWHEFSEATVRRDLAAIAARRIGVITVALSWDAFMPTDRAPHPRRMRDLETFLAIARELGLRVVLGLFAQSSGGCVMLPGYAVDRRSPRRGVRCVTDARAVDGGPRDIYTDPLMLEAQVRWLDAMLAAFAQHPAVAAWDIGHDPASTIRPRRIAEISAWAALLGTRIEAHDEECRLTLGAGDIVRGRGVRLAALATHVDVLGIAMHPQRLALPGQPLDAGRGLFVADLARLLAGTDVPLQVELGIASGDVDQAGAGLPPDTVTAPSVDARDACDELLQRLAESGLRGIASSAWTDWGPRLREAPPADRRPWLARRGIVDRTGISKPIGEAWEALAGVERAVVAAPPPWVTLDVESYYANLPDSLLDLYAAWLRDRGDMPGILS